jgi:hypothetical protein
MAQQVSYQHSSCAFARAPTSYLADIQLLEVLAMQKVIGAKQKATTTDIARQDLFQ